MDTALKQRLIGAIVLVALAVIFLPMLIKGPAPDSGVSDVPLDVPPAPAGQYETRELPLVAPGDAPGNGALGMPAATAPAAAQQSPDPAAGQALPPTGAAGNYAVSFGAYASIADADAVIARLRQSQLAGYREETTINGRTAYRVRIGPYLDRAAAESARLQAVKVRSDVNAQVIALDAAIAAAPAASLPAAPTAAVTEPEPAKHAAPAPKPAESKPAAPRPVATQPVATAPKPAEAPPAKAPPATALAAASVGFAVQLGAFSNAADANALRDRVRGGGFSAFVEQVNTDKGTLNRVRVGPVASRADAERLKAQVAVKFGIDGMVRPHP
ncbi:SPOR domain-containing protein [Pseudoxanthomonas wuyuanensis]